MLFVRYSPWGAWIVESRLVGDTGAARRYRNVSYIAGTNRAGQDENCSKCLGKNRAEGSICCRILRGLAEQMAVWAHP